MNSIRKFILFFALWLAVLPLCAQSVTITKEFTQVPFASALTMYKNEFGHHEKPLLDVIFPYAVIRMHLEGSEREVTIAKQRLTLYMGQHSAPQDRNAEYSNLILFLVDARRPHIYVDCGDGCEKVLLSAGLQLQPEAVYDCTVHYQPYKETSSTTQAPKRQFFKFRVEPSDALVEVEINGQKEMWHVMDGVASKPINYGSYRYTISANRYHTEEGTFKVSDTETEKKVTLRPKFGWLNITGETARGAYVYVTNTITGARQSLGTIPVTNKDLDAGLYSLLIQKDKYKDYTTTITIEESKTNILQPTLEANFVQLTLTTTPQADMYIDGEKLGTGTWTGTLEFGEYSIETRQASHQSAYTTIRVTQQTAKQTISLTNPVPIYGSLTVTSTPADAVVYLDNNKVGTTPLIINELIIGSHDVVIEKDGYSKITEVVSVEEGNESEFSYALIKGISIGSMAASGNCVSNSVSNVQVRQEGLNIIVEYDLAKESDIILLCEKDGINEIDTLNSVYGDIGINIQPGRNTIIWKVLEEYENFIHDNVQFIVRADISTNAIKKIKRKESIDNWDPWIGFDFYGGYPCIGFSGFVPVGLPVLGLYGEFCCSWNDSNKNTDDDLVLSFNVGPSLALGENVQLFVAPGVGILFDYPENHTCFSLRGGIGVDFGGFFGITLHTGYPFMIGIGFAVGVL